MFQRSKVARWRPGSLHWGVYFWGTWKLLVRMPGARGEPPAPDQGFPEAGSLSSLQRPKGCSSFCRLGCSSSSEETPPWLDTLLQFRGPKHQAYASFLQQRCPQYQATRPPPPTHTLGLCLLSSTLRKKKKVSCPSGVLKPAWVTQGGNIPPTFEKLGV